MTILTLLFDVTAGAGNFNLVAFMVWASIAGTVYVVVAERITRVR